MLIEYLWILGMKSKQQSTDLHTAYQTMIDTVEKLVVKEGENIEQALETAEEKLGEAKQFSKKEIHKVSTDLKDNFRLFGETVESANKAYKDQIKLNMSFVNNSIWDKFLSIAETNTEELIEFTKTLKDKTQAIIKTGHPAAHHEHNKWDSEHAEWLEEIDSWKKEHEQGISKLQDIETAMKQQSLAFTEHAQVIQAHNKMTQEHEEVLKNSEEDPTSEAYKETDESEVGVHQQERHIHAQHKELHHKLKAHHLKMMAIINMLHRKIHEMD